MNSRELNHINLQDIVTAMAIDFPNTNQINASNHSLPKDVKFLGCRLDILIYLLLTCCIIGVYWQVNTFSYINYDSPEYVFANNHVRSGLTYENIKWAFTTTTLSNWHPLTWISHMLDVQLYGLNPGQHKLTNVLFHVINTLLLYYLLNRMAGEILPSSLAAVLFALHPLHIQSIAWIAERKDLLSALFFFLSILTYLRFLELRSTARYCLILLTYSLGLMAKPMIVTLPVVLLLLDFWPMGRYSISMQPSRKFPTISLRQNGSLKTILLEKCPLLLLSIISSAITVYAQNVGGSVATFYQLSFFDRISNASTALLLYLYKTIWPMDLSIIYPHPGSQPYWLFFYASAGLICLSYIFLYHFRKYQFLTTGWLLFLVMLLPVIGIIQVGEQAMADRYMYLPIIGPFIILAWSLQYCLKKYTYHPIPLFSLMSAFLIIFLGSVSFKQLQYWKNGVTLFTRALAITQKNFIAHNNLGYELIQKFKFKEAEEQFEKALLINSNFEIAHLNLGRCLVEDGKFEEGINHYQIALKLEPDNADAHKNLGNILLRLRKYHEAAHHYLQFLRLNPESPEVYNNLGAILVEDHKYEEAITIFQKALSLSPSFPEARSNLEETIILKNKSLTGQEPRN